MDERSDEQLMLEYKRGNAEAMDEFLKRYKNPLFRFIYRMSRNTAEAEEITQEVFMRVHEYRNSYRPTGKFSTWLFGIAHNLYVSRLRKRKPFLPWPTRPDNPDEQADFASPALSPMETAASQELSEAIRQCIGELPFLQREALILREYEGLDYEEISEILHKPLGTVKTLIYRARMALRDMLVPLIDEEGGTDVQSPRCQ